FRIDETSLPAEPLDDLSKRRWIDDVLSRADASVGGAQFTRRRSGRIAPRRRVSFYWAAAVVAVITAAVLMYSQTSEPGLSDQQTETAVARVAVEGKLLLSSGEVRSDSAILSFGSALGVGERLAVGQGQAVVDLSTGVTLFLDAETEVSIDRLSTKAMEVELSRGRLVAQVDPERVGPRFEITTRSGRILVTGTAFSVTTEKQQVEVEVFRGSVQLKEKNLQPRRVEVGQAAVLGKAGFVQISEEAGAAAWDVLRTIDMLSRSDAAVVEIRSVPANARVTVDETYLGRTPLSASLRAGHRRLDL
ncbi:MAG: PEGA domain-containing protein, partial [bacterium]|nr:PEGA domain-containing protein [bacterium]